jgi:hypothetical protein
MPESRVRLGAVEIAGRPKQERTAVRHGHRPGALAEHFRSTAEMMLSTRGLPWYTKDRPGCTLRDASTRRANRPRVPTPM